MAETEELWKCPITDKCSPQKLHRKCLKCEKKHGALHCWDCCIGCQQECQGHAAEVDYDLPAGKEF